MIRKSYFSENELGKVDIISSIWICALHWKNYPLFYKTESKKLFKDR